MQSHREVFSAQAERDGVDLQIFIVSDFTGETATSVTRAAIRQFDRNRIALQRFRYVDTEERIREVCAEACQKGALIACTLVSQPMRDYMKRRAAETGVAVVDLFGPLLDAIATQLGTPAAGKPGASYKMDEEYFRRIKAMEFASTCDDGSNPNLLPEAELVIIGVSRTCKTPLSMYLASKGIRTANVPLVPELAPPEELFTLPRGRVLGLSICPEALKKIRRDRLQMLGLDPDRASYARDDRVLEELGYAQMIMDRLQAKRVDVTGRALEETAQEILEYLREQGCLAAFD